MWELLVTGNGAFERQNLTRLAESKSSAFMSKLGRIFIPRSNQQLKLTAAHLVPGR